MFRSTTPLYNDVENDSVPSQCQVIYSDPATVQLLITLLDAGNTSATNQIAVCNVLTSCCSTEPQNTQKNSLVFTSTVICATVSSHKKIYEERQ